MLCTLTGVTDSRASSFLISGLPTSAVNASIVREQVQRSYRRRQRRTTR